MLALRVNGALHEVDADPQTPLLYILRNALGLTAAKHGCGREQCGACAVLADGAAALTCAAPAASFAGRDIVTAEGLAASDAGRDIADAFAAAGAAQCGFCTPGLLVAAAALLRTAPAPDESAVKRALSPHLCRCGAHARVLAAVRAAAQARRDG